MIDKTLWKTCLATALLFGFGGLVMTGCGEDSGESGTEDDGPPVQTKTDEELCYEAAESRGERSDDESCGPGCSCKHCPEAYIACSENEHCPIIQECALRTNCANLGATLCPVLCQAEFEAAGGPLSSAGLVLDSLNQCMTKAGCAQTCN